MNRLIEILKYIFIGIVQGISEILPISSSGHLSLVYFFLNIPNQEQLNLTIFLHFSSSLALCIYFKNIIVKMVKGFFFYIFKKDNKYKDGFMLTIYLMIASIPSAIVGIFIKPLVKSSFDNIFIICINLILTAIILLLSNLFKNNNHTLYTLKNTLVTGLFQCFALIPGISRSGITLFGSKVAKLNEDKGKEFTFLLLIPISLGSTIFSLFDIFTYSITPSQINLYIISFIITFIFTLLSLKLLFIKSKMIKTHYYSIYLIIISILSIFVYHIYY